MNHHPSRSIFHLFTLLILLLLLLGSAVFVTSAHAVPSTWTVQSPDDDGTAVPANCPGVNCRLRDAIEAAPSGATIDFSSDFTITLVSQIYFEKSLTITAVGRNVNISGGGTTRIFEISGDGITVLFNHLTLMDGNGVDRGAAIYLHYRYGYNTLTILDSTFHDNHSGDFGGGAINVAYDTLKVYNSTFYNNTSDIAAGAIDSGYGNTIIENSTFYNNHTPAYAGALSQAGGSIVLTNNTFVGNGAPQGANVDFITGWDTAVTLNNNIFANGTSGASCACDNGWTACPFGGSGNFATDNSCGTGTTVISPSLAVFGSLGSYGGSTLTVPLLPGNPAIDGGIAATCAGLQYGDYDQRALGRVGTCDAGSFESQGFTLTKTGGDNQSARLDTAFGLPLTLNVTSAYGEPVNGGMVTFTAPASGASTNPVVNTATIASGSVSKSVTANSTAGGPYNVTASAAGAANVNFSLTNSCSSSPTLVTNNADSGPCSLRDVIANAPSGSTITFDNDYTITLASQLEIIDKTITITGAGHHITISGNNAVRVFHVGSAGGSGNLTIDHLNIVNGKSTVEECAGSAASCGGGLMLEYLTTATVLNSTFANNDGGLEGGAIYSYYGNPLTVINSTFVNNHALAYAGAIHVFYGSATLTNNTFTSNSATLTGGYGGAILNNWGTVTFKNNIFANNSATNSANCENGGGTFNDEGGGLVWGGGTCPGVNANPFLGTLGDYGGETPTIPLLPGSAAINAASGNCPATDQRGVARGATCDSGAFESQGFTLAITAGNHQTASINTAFPIPLTVSVTSAHGEPVNGGIVTFTPPASGAGAVLTGSPATIATGAASVTATANGTFGVYNVTASTAGASSVDFSLTNTATPIITWANPANIVYGTALGATQLNATADVPGTFTYTPASGAILTVGVHTLHVDFVPTDTVNYTNASKNVSITVTQATPIITWADPAAIDQGTPLGGAQLNATADVPGTFTYTPASGTYLSTGTHTLHVDFVPTDAVNYTAASKDVSLTVNDQVLFTDVPDGYWARTFIERLFVNQITGGCGTNPLRYCPTQNVNRAMMAVFVLRAAHGLDFAPPAATGTIFADVPADSFAAAWIEQLAAEGITSGCGGGNYCPNAPVTRAQMAVFLVKAMYGTAYTPPDATGGIFADVPADGFAAAFIEQLAVDGITGGCGGGNFCPNVYITRGEMAVFLVTAFNLP